MPLIGPTVYYDTPGPASTGWWAAKYRVHWMGDVPDWGKWEVDDDDGGAGNDYDQIDMIELMLAPCRGLVRVRNRGRVASRFGLHAAA